jgi:hypothetical protein
MEELKQLQSPSLYRCLQSADFSAMRVGERGSDPCH